MSKYYRYLRAIIAIMAGLAAIAAFVGLAYPVKIFDVQFSALLQRVLVNFSVAAAVLFAVLLVITLLFGRIYCSTLCPLGLYQEFLMLIFRRKVKIQPNRPYKYWLAAVIWGTFIGGTVYLLRLFDPYTLFGSAISLSTLGISVLLILAVLVWCKGRFFCTNICPVGTVLGLISKHSLCKIYVDKNMCVACGSCAAKCPTGSIDFKNKTVNNETCIKCLRCMSGCRKGGVHYGIEPTEKTSFNPSRRQFLAGSAVLALFAVALKNGIDLSKNITAKIKNVILPAGAGNAEDFANRCLNCNLCVQNCPMKIIKKANADYPVVHLDYSDSFCDYNCNKCSLICPSGALKRLSLAEKQKTQLGVAIIDEDVCIKCGLCAMKCPRQAITKEDGEYPHINPNNCIGCGCCQNGCPVKAITISANKQQKTL